MSELHALSALDAAAGIRSGAFTALAVAEAALARTAALDPSINAFTLVTRERALTEAAAVDAARAAAFVITATEGSQSHLADLRRRPQDFEALIRDRFIANPLAPAAWYLHAQRFRSWFYAAVMRVFEDTDIILAAATPTAATTIGAETFDLNGVAVPTRPSLGLLTQPLSFIGLPIVTVPVHRAASLPIGIQVIARP